MAFVYFSEKNNTSSNSIQPNVGPGSYITP